MGILTIKDASEEILRAQIEFEEVSQSVLLFRREYQYSMQALENNSFLLKVALENPQSLKNAIVNVGAVGLSLNPALRLAYLIPRDGKVCLDVSYIGLLKLAQIDEGVLWGQAYTVRRNDIFKLRGFGQEPIHEYNAFATEQERGEVVGSFCVVKTHDGSYLTTTMTIDEINGIRARSSAWKAWIEKKKSNPWVTDPREMEKKTVIKRAYKTWPKGKTSRLEKAIEVINEYEGIDFEAEKSKEQKRVSMASDLLNNQLGAPVNPRIKELIDSINSTCRIICKEFSKEEKQKFMLKELQVSTFNELYAKDAEYLHELDNYLADMIPTPPLKDENSITTEDIPWDDNLSEER